LPVGGRRPGAIGIALAVLIWRRHVAAMALALFLASVITAIWAAALLVGILAGGFHWILVVYLAIGVVPLLLDARLVGAMRAAMDRAGETAARQTSIGDTAAPAKPS
jgi:hypothetical protein